MTKSPVAYRASSLVRKVLSFSIKAEIFQAVLAAGVVAGMVGMAFAFGSVMLVLLASAKGLVLAIRAVT